MGNPEGMVTGVENLDPPPLPWVMRCRDLPGEGLSRRAVRSGGLHRVGHGIVTVAGVSTEDPAVRIAAVAARLAPGCVVGGWAAAHLHERIARQPDDQVVFTGEEWHERAARDRGGSGSTQFARIVVCAPASARISSGDQVRVFRSVVPPGDRAIVSGVPVTTPTRTAYDLARLWTPTAAVVAVDRLAHLGLVTMDDVRRMADERRRWRGRPAALRALELVDGGAESPQETLLRLLWIEAGLPRPLCNPVILDRQGRFVARVDLFDPQAGVIGEYDGSFHSDAARRSDDARRQQALHELGLIVVRATAADVATDTTTSTWRRRLRRAYQRQLAKPDRAPRWQLANPHPAANLANWSDVARHPGGVAPHRSS